MFDYVEDTRDRLLEFNRLEEQNQERLLPTRNGSSPT
jgi:hypothetical protein